MSRKDKQQELFNLQEKAFFGEIGEQDEERITELTDYLDRTDGPPATEDQKEYLEQLLEAMGSDLSEYTDIELDDMTVEQASDLIDEVKDDLDYSGI